MEPKRRAIAARFGCSFIAVATALILPELATAKGKLEGKLVLANPEKFEAAFRVGKVQRNIAPGKASVLSPKRFPVTLEYWTGNERSGWKTYEFGATGVYLLRYRGGQWLVTKRTAKRTARASAPTRILRPRTVQRATGTTRRVRGGGGVGRSGGRRAVVRPRVPSLTRLITGAAGLYRFVRDEQDRDALRRLIAEREIDDHVRREIDDRLDKIAVNLPAEERRQFDEALRDLKGLDEKDLKDLDSLDEADWSQARDLLGDGVDTADLDAIENDYGELDISDLSEQDAMDLNEIGIDDLDEGLDLGDVDADLGGSLDELDVGDLDIGAADQDTLDVGIDAGTLDEPDVGGYDAGGFDFDDGGGGDFGGFDAGGGDDDFGGGFDDF